MKKSFFLLTVILLTLLSVSKETKAQQYKLRQVTNMMGMKSESTVYVKGMRKRTESAGMMGMPAPPVTIEQCDLQRTIKLNDKKKLYFIEPFATSRLDFPHVLTLQSVYDLPFGKGRRWGSNWNSAVDAILGGWQVNGIWRFQSGQTFDVRRDGVRVNLTGEPYTGNRDLYLNRSAFSNAAAGTFGNLERNSLRGPSNNQLNLGLLKNFQVYDLFKIQFRSEFFNVFNRPQLTPPNTDLNNTDPVFGFGTIRSTYGFTNRQVQFGLRVEF